ncbi:MAG TPA: hypothetical protein PKI19_08945 [Elusimicrobiales bacterium]|nr:hypothetical protein [Elusimicrobiales bacterium]
MKKLLAMTTIATALFATRVSAATNLDEKYLTADNNSVVIEEIADADYKGGELTASTETPKPPTDPQVTPPTNPVDDINGAVGMLDNIVNLMDKIFTLIAKNQPVVNINVNYANAVPFGLTHWTQLQGWSKPATKKYSFLIKNLYGMEVVKVIYQVRWTHSGSYQGKGKFLTGVTVEPLSVNTAWGYNVDLTAEVPDSTIANVGSSADPVASMQVQLKWKVHTIVQDMQEKAIYYVEGNGSMQPIGKAYERGLAQKNQKKMDAVKAQFENVRFN